MATFASIAAAAASVQRFLQVRFAEAQPISGSTTSVAVARTEDFDGANFAQLVQRPALTVHLYRVEYDPTMRAAWSAVGAYQQRSVLALELRFLITAWGANAEEELRILGRAMQALEDTPILSGPLLAGDAWSPGESLQVVMETMETAALLRVFDSLPVDYRLSVPYVARVLRLTGANTAQEPPVATSVVGYRPSLAG